MWPDVFTGSNLLINFSYLCLVAQLCPTLCNTMVCSPWVLCPLVFPGKNTGVPTNAVTANFFDTYKQDRDASRESQLELLNEISNNAYATEIERSTALQNKAELQKKMEKELILEGLIKAKGFEDAVVTIGSEYYNVIVKGGQLTQDQATQILGVITNETKTSPSNVKIIPVE